MKKCRLPALLLTCLLGACSARPTAGVPAEAGASSLQSFRAQHRVTLTFSGRQLDFTGYLLVRGRGDWRAMAFGEFGGSLLDIMTLPGSGTRIIKNPGGIRERWLTGHAAAIIEILCVPPSGERASVSRAGSVYEVTYSDYAGVPGMEREMPRHIVVEEKKIGFRLEADLIKFEPMEIPEKFFAI